ncbi:MAG: hypothetical protein IJ941_02545, partial [Clostridia bacterium]|nr:hypothetical protein [Clostridia bacterium]
FFVTKEPKSSILSKLTFSLYAHHFRCLPMSIITHCRELRRSFAPSRPSVAMHITQLRYKGGADESAYYSQKCRIRCFPKFRQRTKVSLYRIHFKLSLFFLFLLLFLVSFRVRKEREKEDTILIKQENHP